MGSKRRTRKRRRRAKRRLLTGDHGAKHKSKSGRTGKVKSVQRKEKARGGQRCAPGPIPRNVAVVRVTG